MLNNILMIELHAMAQVVARRIVVNASNAEQALEAQRLLCSLVHANVHEALLKQQITSQTTLQRNSDVAVITATHDANDANN